jgi:hypothetical protein
MKPSRCLKRFSSGRIQWWPKADDIPLHQLEAQQLSVLLYNGLPEQAGFAAPWRKLDPNTFSQAARATASTSNFAAGSPRA